MALPRHLASKVRRISNDCFEIIGLPDGERSPEFKWRDQAEKWLEENASRLKLHARKVGPRACLCCGATFPSEGVHNRMCNPCRGRASNDEAAPFSFGAIHGRKRA